MTLIKLKQFTRNIGRGVRRFRLGSSWEEENHLLVGDIEYVEEEPSCALATGDQNLVRILEQLIKRPKSKLKLNIDYSNAVNVSYRLSMSCSQ